MPRAFQINARFRRARSRLADRVREVLPVLVLGKEHTTKADCKPSAWGPRGVHAERSSLLLADLRRTAEDVAERIWSRPDDQRPTPDDLVFVATVLHAFLNGSWAGLPPPGPPPPAGTWN